MSKSFYALSLVGVQVDPVEFIKAHTPPPEMIRECKHKETENMYCAECGRFMWYEEDQKPTVELHHGSYKNFCVLTGTDYQSMAIGKGGISCSADNEGAHKVTDLSTIDLLKLRRELRETLEPLGLWDESKFGIQTILYCSY